MIGDTNFFHGVGPYTVTATQGSLLYTNGDQWNFGPYCVGDQVDYTVQDANGCALTTVNGAPIYIDGPEPPIFPLVIIQISGACNGAANGSAEVTTPGAWNWPTDGQLVDSNGTFIQQIGGIPTQYTFTGLAAGTYYMNLQYVGTGASCGPSASFIIPDLGPTCGVVTGTLFIDSDSDCVQDPGEVGVPNQVMQITPGPYFTMTDAQGDYAAG